MSDDRLTMDPELADALNAIPRSPSGIFDLTNLEGTRAAVRALAESIAAAASPDDGAVTVEEHVAPRGNGPDLLLRVLRPAAATASLPALLWFHGGGQVLGYAAQDDTYLGPVCTAVGCAVISVDYRLAPEFPSPAAVEDGCTAFGWVRANAAALGVDADRIGIAGASGGGGIAAGTALLLRDRGAGIPMFQALSYPMIDDRNVTASSREITEIGIWDRATNVLAWQYILGERAGTDDVSPYSAPARAPDVSGLPPTFLAVGELDVFRDEGLDYAMRLRAAGVPVELHLYSGAYHAWDLFAPAAALTASFLGARSHFMSRYFARVERPGGGF